MQDPVAVLYEDQVAAGAALSERLDSFRGTDAIVIGVSGAGVLCAVEVAHRLGLAFDVVAVAPVTWRSDREARIGTVSEGGVRIVHDEWVHAHKLNAHDLDDDFGVAERSLESRVVAAVGHREPLALAGRTALVIDHGVRSGESAVAALRSVRSRGPVRIVFATPVMSTFGQTIIQPEADEVVALHTVTERRSPRSWFRDTSPITAERIRAAVAERGQGEPSAR